MSGKTLIPNPNSKTLKKQEPMILSDERIEALEPISPPANLTYRRNINNPFKRGAKRFTNRKGKEKIETLLQNLKPKLFSPKKNLNLEKFEQVLRKLDLFEFTRIKFDPVIRIELLVDLISNYDPKKKCSYANGFRISVTKNDLARALKLPIKKAKNGTANIEDEMDVDSEVYSDEEMDFIEDFVFNFLLVNDKDIVPRGCLVWTRCIRDGHPEKLDAAELIWNRVEKELTQGEKLVECHYASHLQCLIQSQRPSLFLDYDDYVGKEVVKGDKGRTRPQPMAQVEPVEPVPYTNTVVSLSSKELSNGARAAKRLKSTVVENLGNKTDREMSKRNVGILEQKLPEKAVAIKEAIKCSEDESERRLRLQCPKEKTRPQVENVKLAIKVEEGEQFVSQNESIDGIIAEEECAATLQTVPVNEDKNRASTHDICAGLKKVSCVLSMLSSPNKFYTPQGNPLDEEAEKAKQTLIQLLDKNFETIVGSPDEEVVKSCIKILTKNLHKLPWFQGRVIESLNAEFDPACQNWEMCHANHQSNIEFMVQQGDKLGVLEKWQEQDMEIESKMETVEADILRLKAELHEKELTRESLVKEKSNLFNQSKMSIDEAEKLVQEMVSVKLQSDVAVDNMNQLAAKWERTRENFKMKQV